MASTGETNRRRSTVSYKSAAIGAASAAASAAAIFAVRPKDPTFQLVSINLSSFHLNLPVLDLELTLAVHVTNPNIVPVRYSPASVSIFYAGSLLGSAALEAGSQPPLSCSLVYLPARLNGLQLAHHAAGILADAARRRMSLDAAVDIAGDARLLFWSHRFMLRLESHVLVDPIFLDVIDQDNHSETHLSLSIMQQLTKLRNETLELGVTGGSPFNSVWLPTLQKKNLIYRRRSFGILAPLKNNFCPNMNNPACACPCKPFCLRNSQPSAFTNRIFAVAAFDVEEVAVLPAFVFVVVAFGPSASAFSLI